MTKNILTCGYVPLVDCAPLLIAKELGFAAEEGLDLHLVKQPSWSALRDHLAFGDLEAAHMLSPMPIAMRLGMGGLSIQIDVMSVMSVNGTVFGIGTDILSSLAAPPAADPAGLLDVLADRDRPLRIGVPFHMSMHRLLLSYWSMGRPDFKTEVITIPPPRMANALADDQIDAFWVGEPWGSVAVQKNLAKLVMTGSQIWGFAPEKVLAARSDWIAAHPEKTRALMRAVYKAGKWLDQRDNAAIATEILTQSAHLDLTHDLVDPAITNEILLHHSALPQYVRNFQLFHKNAAQFPWRSQAAWIAAQLGAKANEIETAKQCFRSDLFRTNLASLGVDMPGASEKVEGAMVHETAVASARGNMILGPDAFFDGRTFDFGGQNRP